MSAEEELSYADKCKRVSEIASPLADEKLFKKILKLTRKATKRKSARRGVKEVVKAVRKKQKGICILAGDVNPLDVICHLPIMCEENDLPYIYTPSKDDLGSAGMSKRSTSCVLLLRDPLKAQDEEDEKREEYEKAFDELAKKIKAKTPVF
ncbi:unnamed protein product [Ostreobium quekettii]|uniref:H/ACA ribonucleoprotein complex subunit 2 n=1 Tax=Ostreobium quekettii TaxID=121088 RepID=A0A8S1JH90_9CHLO|nr:unnamed protein product [Ostreobium quekettii]|eukprot:evm.model.scf_3278.1 EVM.evm.TU.scf_3278.1   scf_3278:9540-11967(+)